MVAKRGMRGDSIYASAIEVNIARRSGSKYIINSAVIGYGQPPDNTMPRTCKARLTEDVQLALSASLTVDLRYCCVLPTRQWQRSEWR